MDNETANGPANEPGVSQDVPPASTIGDDVGVGVVHLKAPRVRPGVFVSLLFGCAMGVLAAVASAVLTAFVRSPAYDGCTEMFCGMGLLIEAAAVALVAAVLALVIAYTWFRRH